MFGSDELIDQENSGSQPVNWLVSVTFLAIVIALASSVFVNGLAFDKMLKRSTSMPAGTVWVSTLDDADQPIPNDVLNQMETDTGLKYTAQLTNSVFTAGKTHILVFDTPAQAQEILGLTDKQTTVLVRGDLLIANGANQKATFTSEVNEKVVTKDVVGYVPDSDFWFSGPVAAFGAVPANPTGQELGSTRIYAGLDETQINNLLDWPRQTSHNEVKVQSRKLIEVKSNVPLILGVGLLVLTILLIPLVALGLSRKMPELQSSAETKVKLTAVLPALATAVLWGTVGSLVITAVLQTSYVDTFKLSLLDNFTFTAISIISLSLAVGIGALLAVKLQRPKLLPTSV